MSYINIIRSAKRTPSSFDPFIRPGNDGDRLNALQQFEIFDTPSEEIFSAYTELAALTIRTPIALMSFVGEDTVHYKEAYGVARTGQLVPRKNSPCSIAIMNKDLAVFRYALSDPCILADEKNMAEAGYKFYAGAPLVTNDGFRIGMLAVADRSLRIYADEELFQLKQLAAEVMHEVELRLELRHERSSLHELNQRLTALHKRVETARLSR